MAYRMKRSEYADICGPTVGDKIHLADTGLIAEIEYDYYADDYGDETIAGGGKSFRDGMGMTPGKSSADGILDVAFTNVVIIDPKLGIVKGDIGVKDGKIVGVGRCGNPYTMNVTPGLEVGASTEVIPLPGTIVTAGGLDIHIHALSPDQTWEAMANGLTTLIGGGSGSKVSTIETPGPWHLQSMIEAHEALPINVGFLGRGNSSLPETIREQALNGAIGMKIHEDYGATPEVIRTCLDVADEFGFQVQIHTDTLNESGYVNKTIEAIGGRTMHAYHVEGAGGGHAPDIMTVVGEQNILPSSTNSTNPYTKNTLAEFLGMIMPAHALNPKIPEDVAFAESRIRGETIAAEDVLHDMGAISVMSSDSQGMGRVGESILRTWQVASSMKKQRGPLPEETGDNDNQRILRYIAKYTINPAIMMGIDDYVGSIESGKMADLVVWDIPYFGAKMRMLYKSGAIVYSHTGDVNAATEWCQPIFYRKQFAAYGNNVNRYNKVFVTQAAIDNGLANKVPYSAEKLAPIKDTRHLTKADMIRNNYCPNITIDPETYEVFIDGEHITCNPIDEVALGQKYFFR